MTVFGTIITGKHVRKAMAETLKTWSTVYLAEVARQDGRVANALPALRSITFANESDKWNEDQLPAGIVVAPGLLQEPVREGRGRYRARWAAGVAVVVSGPTREATQDLVDLYSAAVRALVIQHPSLGGFSDGVVWMGERYDELDNDDARTIAAGLVQFGVDVSGVIDSGGPVSVPADPFADPGDWPEVKEVLVSATDKEI